MVFIYRLYINDTTIYIGKSNNIKMRYKGHKKDCFNENNTCFNLRLYTTIRQLGITRDNFYEYVKIEILYENVPEGYDKKMEQLLWDCIRDFGSNLWNELNADFDGMKDIIKRNQKN